MTAIPSQTFEASLAQLTDLQNLRVWSIIVSLFGDLAQKTGDQISGTALTQIITPMGIKPEAIRVALHRLRKDGWIESSRSGRASVHYLTEFGRNQSAAVTPRIYARTPEPPQDWHLLIADDSAGQAALEETLLLPQYTQVNRRTALGYGAAPTGLDDLLVAQVSELSLPSWLQARLFPQDLIEACQSLQDALIQIPAPTAALTPVQVASLRTLVVHHWRRIALRHPILPSGSPPEAWCGESCRAHVFELLDSLPRPQLQDLEQ